MRLPTFNGYFFSEGLIFDLITVDFWGEINLFHYKIVAFTSVSSDDIKAHLIDAFSLALKFKEYKTDVLMFINQFNFKSLDFEFKGLKDWNSYARLFRLWDHAHSENGFPIFYKRINGKKLKNNSFYFSDYSHSFKPANERVHESTVAAVQKYRNPHQDYFSKIIESTDPAFLFASVLNLHNHFDAKKKLKFQEQLQGMSENYKYDQLQRTYEDANEQQWYFMQIEDKKDREEMVTQFITKNPGFKVRFPLCFKMAAVPYTEEGNKRLSRMAKAYDLQFMVLLKNRNFIVPGVNKKISNIIDDLDNDESDLAMLLKEESRELWLSAKDDYRQTWINYLTTRYRLPRDKNEDLEVYLVPILIYWAKKLQKEYDRNVKYENSFDQKQKSFSLVQ